MTESVTCAKNLQYIPAHVTHGASDLRRLLPVALLELGRTNRVVNDSEVASLVGYSSAQIRRLCLFAVGETAHSFTARLRLERAAGQLAVEQRHIAGVVSEAGFLAREAFSRAFAAHFGCAPAEFRMLNCGSSMPLPGYQMGFGDEWARAVRVKFRATLSVTFMFDGPVFLGRVVPGGLLDWRSAFHGQPPLSLGV